MFNLDELETDLGLRIPINEICCTDKQNEEVRRAYLLKGPCQPKDHNFPFTLFGDKKRRFTPEWYKEGPSWMEYSVAKDCIFCLNCCLFKTDYGDQADGEVFVSREFNNWKDKAKVKKHVGDHYSTHNQCHAKCVDLINQRQHIDVNLACVSKNAKLDYRILLNASIDCIRFLLHQGLAFRGHDESVESENQVKEQMTIVFRYVDKIGCVIESFIRVVHVKNTSAKSLKIAIDEFYKKKRLSLTSLRGQGYDGASNMRVLDNIQEELNNRFDEVNMRLRLLQYVSTNANFTHVEGIVDLTKKMVEFKKDVAYNKVFLLIKLALVLPVATATVERVFSAINLVKNSLRNRMRDD
ncbi:uncharacterized protein LOC116142368 [Pistacia vera]|uniref:uncharacterized protein LOC116142368 n=1 Tax=Pistacia vera TaxID=55513 RepID=UPI001262B9FB|nr:uncharacterized protein LOC116142368 [Pistacia vera]